MLNKKTKILKKYLVFGDILHYNFSRTQNSELRILFNIIHEDCNKLVIVTIIKITVIKRKKYETKYIILFNKKKL